MKEKIRLGYYCADVNPKNTKSLGIYKFTIEILNNLIKDKNFEVILILSKDNEVFFNKFKCKKEICKSERNYFFKKIFIFPSFANRIAKQNKLDILFFPKGHIPLFKTRKTKYVSMIHDLIPIYYLKKGNFSFIFTSFLLWWSSKFSDLILTNSNYSKKQIEKITKKPIQVIPLGYNKPKKTINPHIKKEYVFIIGNKNPHKNLKKSIDLLKKYNLIYKKKYIPIYSLGKFSEEELAGIYKRAKFSFFLSEIEGFGLPLIESYSQETPVVFNNKTSLAELGKNLPGKCDVNNEISVFKAIEEIEKLNKIEIKQIKKELLKKYNWDKAIKEIENIFYNLIKNNN